MSSLASIAKPTWPPIIKASGAEFCDAFGHQLFDLSSQTLNLVLGHCHPEINEALKEQINSLHFTSGRHSHLRAYELADRIIEIAPVNLKKVILRFCDGSDAVECAIKLARRATGKRSIAVVERAWHGETMALLAAASHFRHRSDIVCDPGFLIAAKHERNPISSLITLVSERHEELACVLIDPILVSNGLPLTRQELTENLTNLRTLCSNYGVLLIFDEIQSFGGWLDGEFFAANYLQVVPDIVVIAKALGAGLPIAAVLIPDYLDGLLQYNEAEFTNGGQPLACAAAIRAIQVSAQLAPRTKEIGRHIDASLVPLLSKISLELRRLGTIISVRLKTPTASMLLRSSLYERGIAVRATDEHILLKCPLVITDDQIREVSTRLNVAVAPHPTVTSPEKLTLFLPMQPTPNGRMHLGHLAGPYLCADILSRAINTRGGRSMIVCGSDSHENWVAEAARKQRVDPVDFARTLHFLNRMDLRRAGIEFDLWIDPLSTEHKNAYRETHEQFIAACRTQGSLISCSERIPVDTAGVPCIGALVSGSCPSCNSPVRGNSCTRCGAGFQPDELQIARHAVTGEVLTWKELESLFLECGHPVDFLIGMLKERSASPLAAELARTHFERVGLRVRLTQPGTWGVRSAMAPPGSVLTNAFYLYCVYCCKAVQELFGSASHALERSSEVETVALFGTDNAAVALAAPLLFSSSVEGFRFFDKVLMNHMLEWEGEKFSTSRNHGIWIETLANEAQITSDEIRFALSAMSLMDGRQNLSLTDLKSSITELRLFCRDTLPFLLQLAGEDVDPRTLDAGREALEEQAPFLRTETADIPSARETLVQWLERGRSLRRSAEARAWLHIFCCLAAALLPNLALAVWRALGFDGPILLHQLLKLNPMGSFNYNLPENMPSEGDLHRCVNKSPAAPFYL